MPEYQLTENFEHDYHELDLPVIQTVTFGNGKKYFVRKNGVPYLTAEVDSISDFFDKACIFGKYLCIGTGSSVIFVNLDTMGSLTLEVSEYFGYFFIYEDILYIASGKGITAVNGALHTIWKNEELALDGVIIHEVLEDRNALRISVLQQMDSTDYWKEKLVNIKNGEMI